LYYENKYIVQHKSLKQYLAYGLKLTNVRTFEKAIFK